MEKNGDNMKKVCGACLKEKELKSFYRNIAYKDGYDSRCKHCKMNGILLKSRKPKSISKTNGSLKLTSPTKEDYRTMYEFLEKSGYDLKKDIHLQFCEKYNFKPKKRKTKSDNTFSVEDIFG